MVDFILYNWPVVEQSSVYRSNICSGERTAGLALESMLFTCTCVPERISSVAILVIKRLSVKLLRMRTLIEIWRVEGGKKAKQVEVEQMIEIFGSLCQFSRFHRSLNRGLREQNGADQSKQCSHEER